LSGGGAAREAGLFRGAPERADPRETFPSALDRPGTTLGPKPFCWVGGVEGSKKEVKEGHWTEAGKANKDLSGGHLAQKANDPRVEKVSQARRANYSDDA
jgi:hypothetical protein